MGMITLSSLPLTGDGLKAVFVTDLHVRESDLDLQKMLLERLRAQIDSESPDIVLIGGDMTGWTVPHKASPAERNLVASFLAGLARQYSAVICVRGNHDYPGDFEFLNLIDGLYWVEGSPTWWKIPVIYPDRSRGVLAVWCLPWVDRSAFDPSADWTVELRKLHEASLLEAPPEATIKIAVAHAAVRDVPMHPGQPVLPTEDPLVSRSLFLPFDAFFLGHYHEPQMVLDTGLYGGSPFINEYGESTHRGYTSWTKAGGFRVNRLAQPKKVLYEVDTDSEMDWSTCGLLAGDKAKVVIHVESPGEINLARMKGIAMIRAALDMGVEAKVVFDVAKTERLRDGATEIASVTTMRDKFIKWVGVLADEPKESDVERALDLLDVIESALDGGK